MPDIIHRIGIKAPITHVYNAITTIEGLSHWWTRDTEGIPETGGTIKFTFRTMQGDLLGEMSMLVSETTDQKHVSWVCTDGPGEWIGTNITFDLSMHDDQTILLFGHRNWREAVEFMAHCSMKWAVFLLSLRDYVETGEGKPSPYDLKIDNWN